MIDTCQIFPWVGLTERVQDITNTLVSHVGLPAEAIVFYPTFYVSNH